MTAPAALRTKQFIDQLRGNWQKLAPHVPELTTGHVRIGPWRVRHHHLGSKLGTVFGPALAHHQRFDPDGEADLEILCIDAGEKLIDIGMPPWTEADIGPMGFIKGLEKTELRALWDYQRRVLHIIDLATGFGVVIVSHADSVPGWERTFPFRNLLHWHALHNDGVLVHAAAVAGSEGALLMVGDSGAGKSTTALAAAEAGLKLLGDDFVAVTFGHHPMVHSLYASAKLTADSTVRFDRLRDRMTFRIGTEHEKNIFFLDAIGQRSMQASAPVAGLVHLVQSGADSSAMLPSSAGHIFRQCAANTLSLLPGDRAQTLAQLSRLSGIAPAYELRLGRSVAEVGAFLRGEMDRQAA